MNAAVIANTNTAFQKFREREQIRLTLAVDATNMCQFACGYCYFGDKGRRKVDVNRVFQSLRNFLTLFSDRMVDLTVHYMGGEPLLAWKEILNLNSRLRPYLAEMAVGFRWSLSSNLAALDSKKAAHLKADNANIHCSLDGPPHIHDKTRPYLSGKPSFRSVAANVPLALSFGPKDTARVTVCPEDAKCLLEVTEFIFKRGVESVCLFPAQHMDYDAHSIDTSELPPFRHSIPEWCYDCEARAYCNGGCWADNVIVNSCSTVPIRSRCALLLPRQMQSAST